MTARRIFVAGVVSLLLYQAGLAVGVALVDDNSDRWVFVLIFGLGTILLVAGLRTARRSPMWAGILIAVGVLPSILLFWMVIPPVIAVGVAVYALINGRKGQLLFGTTPR